MSHRTSYPPKLYCTHSIHVTVHIVSQLENRIIFCCGFNVCNKKFPLASSMSGGLTISGSASLAGSYPLGILYRVRTPARRRLKVGQNLIVLTSEDRLMAAASHGQIGGLRA